MNISKTTPPTVARLLDVQDRQALIVCGTAQNTPEQNPPSPTRLIGYNYIREGEVSLSDTNNMWTQLGPGTVFCFGSEPERIRYNPNRPYSEYFIVIDLQTANHLRKIGIALPEPGISFIPPPEEHIENAFATFIQQAHDESISPSHILIQFQTLCLQLQQYHHSTDTDLFITAACQMLTRIWTTPIPSIAEQLGCSPTHFRRRFRESTGFSPLQYRRIKRIEQAQILLNYHSVKAVSYFLDYSTPFTFSLHFKKAVGMSPSQWKNYLRENNL